MSNVMAQINVRIDKDLKQAGDAVLAGEGMSPSEVVRALWNKLAQHGEALDEVKRVLFGGDDSADMVRHAELVWAGWKISDEFYQLVGLERSDSSLHEQPWDELYAEAMDEHYAQRGLYQ